MTRERVTGTTAAVDNGTGSAGVGGVSGGWTEAKRVGFHRRIDAGFFDLERDQSWGFLERS
ncbi:hypothetical protein HanXRQr2_Chr02g0060511 [Helianthus annuus]|uniref:Uncharacterized protein n=1 Tax=Helianthus annuus TaxID=4232 RepID=A0A9K3JMS9_HELAN|nr:hypothetical protein HanXRQr2_Chr02g0060511 [Helianthus annuus]